MLAGAVRVELTNAGIKTRCLGPLGYTPIELVHDDRVELPTIAL